MSRPNKPVARTASGTAPSLPRKVSQPSVAQNSSPKFYDGPTVSAKADEAKARVAEAAEKAKVAANKSVAVAKKQSKKAVASAKRHPWGIVSLITTIPFLLLISLASTITCPPPTTSPSIFSRTFLAPLGLAQPNSPHSSLHQTLCHPANVYHQTVLEPYVYPVIDQYKNRLVSHPLYVSGVEPAYRFGQSTSRKIWEGPVRPIVDRVVRGARKFYLTFVEPHIPYLKAQYYTLTSPYTSRISDAHGTYIAPHIAAAKAQLGTAAAKSIQGYNYVSTHPLTGTASSYANKGYKVGREKGDQAYVFARPHVIKGAKEAERIAKEILGPRAVKGLEWGAEQATRGWAVVKVHVSHIYHTFVHPHVGPHLEKASTTLSPYASTLHAKVYQPYLLPALKTFLPSALFLSHDPPKTFWSLIADKLPSLGSNTVEKKSSMENFYEAVESSEKPAKVKVPDTKNLGKKTSEPPLPPPNESKEEKKERVAEKKQVDKLDREEMERVREAIKARVNEQGKKGYEKVQTENLLLMLSSPVQLVEQTREFVEATVPQIATHARDTLEREISHVIGGLDKLYSKSTTLSRTQVGDSTKLSDERVAKKVAQAKEMLENRKKASYEIGKTVVRDAMDAEKAALGNEYVLLADRMAWMDGATQKDWAAYHDLKDLSESWQTKYMDLHKGASKNKQLNSIYADRDKALASIAVDINDLAEAFRGRMAILKRAALDKIEAREVLATESKTRSQSRSATASESRVSILPIAEVGAEAAAAAAGIIGKGREQVVDALNQVRGVETSTGIASILNAASLGIHEATRSVISAVGATPSPESPLEHLESIKNVVADRASELLDSASSGVHHATRSVIAAVGATPSPESPSEHLESIADIIVGGAASAYGVIGDAAASAYEAVGDKAASASEQLHQATRSAQKAVGVTPVPETPQEYVESIASGALSLATEASSSVSSLASVASEAVHDATRTALKAVSVTPSPEALAEHAESLASVASSAVHEATRSAMKAVGVTPSPESPKGYIESIASSGSSLASNAAASASSLAMDSAASASSVASEAAASASSLASLASASASSMASEVAASVVFAAGSIPDDLSSLTLQIQSALGLAPTSTPIVSSASAYLENIAASGSSVGAEALASGSSILVSLQNELHQATRAASRAVGATPTPETPGEHVEAVRAKIGEAAEVVVSSISSGVAAATEGVKIAIGRDEL
ncbi:hypothetical protein P7C73_g490, partial [Tremellales sp. Uapishka_1]